MEVLQSGLILLKRNIYNFSNQNNQKMKLIIIKYDVLAKVEVQRISTLKTHTSTDLTNLLVTGSMELENKNGGSSSSSGFSNCYQMKSMNLHHYRHIFMFQLWLLMLFPYYLIACHSITRRPQEPFSNNSYYNTYTLQLFTTNMNLYQDIYIYPWIHFANIIVYIIN